MAEAGVVLMDLTLKTIALDKGAAAILGVPSHHYGKLEPAAWLPKEILAVIRSDRAADLESFKTRIRFGNDEYTCRGFLLDLGNGLSLPPMAVLYLERLTSASDALHEVSAKYHLTQREQEALAGILTGLTSKELADRMNITPNTLKVFLRMIKIKMGVTTRAGMVGKLVDRNYAHNGPSAV